jgi:hypothetical protein
MLAPARSPERNATFYCSTRLGQQFWVLGVLQIEPLFSLEFYISNMFF